MNAHAKNGAKMATDYKQIWNDLKNEVKIAYPIDRALDDCAPGPIRWRGHGAVRQACCPFHVDKTPSFQADINRGVYHCFGAGCNASGDVFSLLSETLNISFTEAVIEGARRSGVTIPDELANWSERTPKRDYKPQSRKQAYRPSAVKEVPSDLKESDLVAVSPETRIPHIGQKFRMWQDGGRFKDKKFEAKQYQPVMVHEYRNIDNELIMCVLRCLTRDGKKYFIPARLMAPEGPCPDHLIERAQPGLAWVNEGPGEWRRRPVYGMEDAAKWHQMRGRNVLIVEGEKSRDAARRFADGFDHYTDWLPLSPMGGANAAIYADWMPLLDGLDREITFTIWQDADRPLMRPDGAIEDRQKLYISQVATSILQAAIDLGIDTALIRINHITVPEDVESGWDIADAEDEGWEAAAVLQHIKDTSRSISGDMVVLRDGNGNSVEAFTMVGAEASADIIPFIPDFSADEFDQHWVDMDAAGDDSTLDPEIIIATDNLSEDESQAIAQLSASVVAEFGEVEEIAINGLDGEIFGPDEADPELDPDDHNPYYRCLGYLDNASYVLNLSSNQIFTLTTRSYTPPNMLHLAPLEFWSENYHKAGKDGNTPGVHWDQVYNDIIQNCYNAGPWDPRREVRQGTHIDGANVVFHTGQKLYVEGRGTCDLHSFRGEKCYTIGPANKTPDFENPFEPGCPEIEEYLRIISNLNWRKETRELSIIAVFGWVMLSPICGILEWRPHLWLDGPLSAGKTWAVTNLIGPALGDYADRVVANSTESGIRNILNHRAAPIIFDEAEGDDKEDQIRMKAILKLARHSATVSNAVVAQGVSGGGAHRHYSIKATFLMTSIVPQLEDSADKSRFGRARLAKGWNYQEFTEKVQNPARELLKGDFSDRFVAMMIKRAKDYHPTYDIIVQALSQLNIERRIIDVIGSFATGAWLALKQGVPADIADAMIFITERFGVMEQVQEFNDDIRQDKDHNRVYREINASEVRTETKHYGVQSFQFGALIEVACGVIEDDSDGMVSQADAIEILKRHGLRPGIGGVICKPGEVATHMLIHKNAAPLRKLLEHTPYGKSYVDVMQQAEDVSAGPNTRFAPGVGSSRTLVVPLKYFDIGAGNE